MVIYFVICCGCGFVVLGWVVFFVGLLVADGGVLGRVLILLGFA